MEKGHFKISAELLQKNATKVSIRDLNAEFQMKGGEVIYKTSKKGDTYLLSHPDEEYLESFRLRLFKELGLIEEKDLPKEVKEPQAPPPRYGDKHQLRRGWNVRSPKEFKEGRYNPEDRMGPELRPGEEIPAGRVEGEIRTPPGERNIRSSDEFRPSPRTYDPAEAFREGGPEPEYKTFEERWGDVSYYIDIVKNALENGAVDDGEIIKYAYNHDIPKERIRKLKKILWDNRCRGERTGCPHGKKKFRFEDLMKVCSGKVEGWEKIDSPFIQFVELWSRNMEAMYGPYRDKVVWVEGKISSYKPIIRKNSSHLKILLYDTLVTPDGTHDTKETRKLWLKIGMEDFMRFTEGSGSRVDDIVRVKGKCVLDSYFNDYWIVDVEMFDVVTQSDGEPIVLSPQEP
ncbi:MAG TPA: hypothetical protein ENK47_04815 [Euryarchaeota archaeon]|nr:hypothetical protein [Euryarchaeota archaeon]